MRLGMRLLRIRPKDTGLLTVLTLLGIFAIFFFDIIFRGKTLAPDVYDASALGVKPPYGYPKPIPKQSRYSVWDPAGSSRAYKVLIYKHHDAYKRGRLPLWNPHQGLGAPLAANPDASAWYPLFIPLYISPSPTMWDYYLIFQLWIAAFFTFLYARLIGLSNPGALAAAAVYSFSGYFILNISINHVVPATLLPFLFYSFERFVQDGKRSSFLLAVIAVTLSLLAPFPEVTLLTITFVSIYYIFRVVRRWATKASFLSWLKKIGLLLLIGVIAALLSAIHLVPMLEFLLGGWHTHEDISHGTMAYPLKRMLYLFIPYLVFKPAVTWSGLASWIGIFPVILALLTLFLTLKPEISKVRWFFIIVAVLSFAKICGAPLVNTILGTLPLFSLVKYPVYLMPTLGLSIAILAGIALTQIARGNLTLKMVIPAVTLFMAGLSFLIFLNRDLIPIIPSEHLLKQAYIFLDLKGQSDMIPIPPHLI
jgi:hypothetical protein